MSVWEDRHDIVVRVMKGFTFTRPVEPADTAYVQAALHAALPGCACSVALVHPRAVRVQVFDELGLNVYGLEHIVVDPR